MTLHDALNILFWITLAAFIIGLVGIHFIGNEYWSGED